MIFSIFIFSIVYLIILFSSLGFGLIFFKITKINIKNFNFGYAGLCGIFFLIFISFVTHLFLPHNSLHNSIIHTFGLIYFLLFLVKKKESRKDLIKLIIIILLFISGLFLSKNNEDFPYYHLPFAMQIVEHKLQFGISHFNTAFRTASSLFYLHSLFYFPYIKYYLFHASGLIILTFFNFILINKFFFEKYSKNIKIEKILSILIFVFINTSFNRLAEYGTDRAGQIIIFLIFIMIFNILADKKFFIEKLKIIFVLLLFAISIKSYFYSYLILVPFLIFILFKSGKIKKFFSDKVFSIIFFLFIFLLFILNLTNTGCLIYPLKITCFDNLFWAVSKESVANFSSWYELWSKAGATPNFRVDNPDSYLKFLAWIPGWFERYFFTKVTDHLFVISIIIIYFQLLFKKKKKKLNFQINNSLNLVVLYLIIFLFLIWFFKHPDLRYGGYVITVMLFFLPVSILFFNYDFENNKKIILTILITILIFNFKNITRIRSELHRVDIYKYKNFPFFHIENVSYKELVISNNVKVFIVTDTMCWATPSPCLTGNINVKKISGYYFFYP